jgi:hypothetical protein
MYSYIFYLVLLLLFVYEVVRHSKMKSKILDSKVKLLGLESALKDAGSPDERLGVLSSYSQELELNVIMFQDRLESSEGLLRFLVAFSLAMQVYSHFDSLLYGVGSFIVTSLAMNLISINNEELERKSLLKWIDEGGE